MTDSTVVRGAGVFIDGRVCSWLWPALRQLTVDTQRRNGAGIRPEVTQAIEDMRAAALAYSTRQAMSVSGHVSRTSADMAATCARADEDDYTANELADALHCSPRHARRLATASGIEPRAVRPYRWRRADVAVLLEHRRPA
ncbi:MAG: hypothetical protein JWP40_2432 [Blastococcus sp.]|nr:hypothetical protein [Blastococcus sp.]